MGTSPVIHERTLYDCWRALNNYLYFQAPNWEEQGGVDNIENPWILKRDFGLSAFNITLRADEGFGLPEKNLPFFNYEKRLKTLRSRYIDPPLWQEGIDRLIHKKAGGKLAAPMTFTILFHRQATSEASVPTGGGCLVAFNLVNFKKKHRLHITMRASEVTCRLLSDMYFFQMLFREIHQQVKHVMPKLDPDNLPIDITILLASQVKHYQFCFWLWTEGLEGVMKRVTSEPQNLWQKDVINHFWDDYIWPENINWSQRKKWSEVFYNECERMNGGNYIDWRGLMHLRGDKNHLPKPKQFRGKYKKERPWDGKEQVAETKRRKLLKVDFTNIPDRFGRYPKVEEKVIPKVEEVAPKKRGPGRPPKKQEDSGIIAGKGAELELETKITRYSFDKQPFRLVF